MTKQSRRFPGSRDRIEALRETTAKDMRKSKCEPRTDSKGSERGESVRKTERAGPALCALWKGCACPLSGGTPQQENT